MRKILWALSLLLVFLTANPCLSEENINVTGTWEGTITLSGLDINMEIVLELVENNGAVTGHISDDWGYLNCDITDPVLKDNILTFKAMVESSQSDHQMAFRMTVAGDKMTGQWESLGSFGEWSLVRKDESEEKSRTALKIEDIQGVWAGPAAYKSNPGSKNILTLALEEKKGKLFGTFSDQMDTNYLPVLVKSFRENNLVLEIKFVWKDETYTMDMDINIKDRTHMRGKFRIEKMGRTGIWTAEKKMNSPHSLPIGR
ncbi:MAG: hypothetical protein JXB26_04275 [Candidatus Aminicenantes bacterium]|nr:hypothetical protein [Candidatus Aminicenantes bacterium]